MWWESGMGSRVFVKLFLVGFIRLPLLSTSMAFDITPNVFFCNLFKSLES